MKRDQRYFIGVDGGATKTHVVVTDLTGRVVGQATVGPSNYHLVGSSAAGGAIVKGCRLALQKAHGSWRDIGMIACGLAGIDSQSDRTMMERSLRQRLPASHRRRFFLINDIIAGFASGTDEPAGAAMIAGTGSNAYARSKAGREYYAGGLGHLFSADGSAFSIGRQALQAATRSFDGRGPQTQLEQIITRRLRVQTIREAAARLPYRLTNPATVAAFAPFVDSIAARGDRVARQILDGTADELALMAITVIRQARLRGRFPLVLIGSVLGNSQRIRRRFQRIVRRHSPNVQFVSLSVSPALGAARLAMKKFA